MEERPEILTVGHSTHPIERFLRLLAAHSIEALADVRRYPGSRRNPQFNSGDLARSLSAARIGYASFGEELGGRRRASAGRQAASAWRNQAFAAYAEHMRSEAFAAGLGRLEQLAGERRTAVMCAEANWRRCHRRLIADALTAAGWSVLHIGPDGRLEPHHSRLAIER
jgi:uncharacterized protein (DUF488 family)